MSKKSALDPILSPGIFRLFLAFVVVFQHANLIALGHWAVYVFFILSGYWVAAMWSEKYRHCRTPYATFIISRFWRLLPLYLVCVVMACAVIIRFSAQGPEVLQLLRTPGWVVREAVLLGSAMQKLVLPPSWSLDIEMQFYLVAPLAILLVAACVKSGGWLPRIVLVGIMAATAFTVVLGTDLHLGRYCGFFLAGLLLFETKWNPGPRIGCAALGLIGLTSALLLAVPATHDWIGPAATHGSGGPLHLTNQIICTAFGFLVVPYVAFSVHVRSSRLDRHFGNAAYPVYLFHYVAKLLVENAFHRLPAGSTAALAVDLAIVVAGVVALYFVVDLPLEKARKRFVASRLMESGAEKSRRD